MCRRHTVNHDRKGLEVFLSARVEIDVPHSGVDANLSIEASCFSFALRCRQYRFVTGPLLLDK